MADHTPTPWALDGVYVVGEGGLSIADCGKSSSYLRGTQVANANFILKACNEYDALRRRIAVLEMIIREDLHPDDCSDVMNQTIVEEIHALTPPAGRAALQEAGRS